MNFSGNLWCWDTVLNNNRASQIWRSMHLFQPFFNASLRVIFFTWKRKFLLSKMSNQFCNLFSFSVLFIVIGIAVFGGKMEQMGYSVGWSMGLAIAGVVLAFLAGIMEVLELRWSHFLPRHLFVPKILVTFFVASDIYFGRTLYI